MYKYCRKTTVVHYLIKTYEYSTYVRILLYCTITYFLYGITRTGRHTDVCRRRPELNHETFFGRSLCCRKVERGQRGRGNYSIDNEWRVQALSSPNRILVNYPDKRHTKSTWNKQQLVQTRRQVTTHYLKASLPNSLCSVYIGMNGVVVLDLDGNVISCIVLEN